MADSFLDTAGGLQQVPTVDVVEQPEQPYLTSAGSMQSALAITVGSGGEIIEDGDPIEVKPSNGTTASYQGTFDDGAVTLPANVAMTADADAVGIWNASDDSRGDGSAFVNEGFLTAVRLPAQNDVVGNGASVIISRADNTGLLASGTANVPADTNTFQNVALPHDYAVIQDGGTINMLDYGSGGGQVAGTARVSANDGSVQLSNSTTKIAINAAPAQVTGGGKTVGVTLAVDQGNWQPFPLVTATDAIAQDGDAVTVNAQDGTVQGTMSVAANAVSGVTLPDTAALATDGMTLQIPVTGTYTDSVTLTVAGGVITAIELS
ncbi:hypothetical protein [Pelagibacterium sp. H642]|uniref:hypothetical protein n=1 Tax=Pelagibacterium sp. H642 TaxID=1881069 RepID=UPI00281614B1|nr:hypothetical protein [Pelagibacterium sp. H642]WMT90144.1 hypothetical protein NO934_15300 [Pelagibacterium sp. H642]